MVYLYSILIYHLPLMADFSSSILNASEAHLIKPAASHLVQIANGNLVDLCGEMKKDFRGKKAIMNLILRMP